MSSVTMENGPGGRLDNGSAKRGRMTRKERKKKLGRLSSVMCWVKYHLEESTSKQEVVHFPTTAGPADDEIDRLRQMFDATLD